MALADVVHEAQKPIACVYEDGKRMFLSYYVRNLCAFGNISTAFKSFVAHETESLHGKNVFMCSF